jgi:peptide chain release factor 1
MNDKLDAAERRYNELQHLLGDPSVIADRESYRKYSKENAELEQVVGSYREWKEVEKQLEESRQIFQNTEDQELREMARAETDELRERKDSLYKQLLLFLLPKDPNDKKNIILEIRAGTGGDEAALFAEELFSAYVRYAEKRRWSVELISTSSSNVGGMKEVTAQINGDGAFSIFKYERGVHRVQRVPKTETQGRVHTSTVTVAVLPEAEEVDLQINDKDLRIDVFRSSGPGGQSVNTTDSAVRVTHLPTGMVVSCQDEKSQHKNKAKALNVLRARLLDQMQAEKDKERSDERRSQIGTGERSEKIRTYNFPQGRVTDHRIGFTIHQIDSIMGGQLDLVIEPLVAHYQEEALKDDGAPQF